MGLSLASSIGCEVRGGTPETTASGGAAKAEAPTATSEAASPHVHTFRSRPDLSPPTVEVVTPARATAPGYVFIAPKEASEGQYGAMIADEQGRIVWFKPVDDEGNYAMDCKAQTYKGEPVLTFWEGRVTNGYGLGEYRILDSSYKEVKRVRSDGYRGDHHDFTLTARDTALITIYNHVPADLSEIGRQPEDIITEGVIQEIDVETGEVVFEWHSLDHVGTEESYADPMWQPSLPYDYFHINSIDVEDDDNLLVSARKTYAIYKIDRDTGEILWRLGGKNSDFEMGPGSQVAEQHDARRHPDGTITIFDNGREIPNARSRGVTLALNMENMSVELAREYYYPGGLLAENQANMQVLPNGNVFIGWGSDPFFSEFSRDGRLLYNASLPPEAESYRAFRFPWEGRPAEKPAVAVESGPEDEAMLYVSWNGATEVANWQVLAGPEADRLEPVSSAAWKGFETAIPANTTESYIAVQGRDFSNRVLGVSEAIEL